jgi:acyl-CoA synthetase (AMP-forming)/AMP-acid ligase II
LPLTEVGSIVTRCGVSTLVTDAALFDTSIRSRHALPVEHWVQEGGQADPDGFLRFTSDWFGAPPAAPANVTPTDTVAVFYSSGTEGSPRGAMLSSQALLAGRVVALLSALVARRDTMALFTLPWAHIMAVSTALYGLLAGVPACLLPRFDVQAAISAIETYRINVVVGVPSMFIRLVNAAPAPRSLATVQLWVSSSDHLPGAYRRRLLEYGALVGGGRSRFRIKSLFMNAYGMVELGGIAMFGMDGPFLPGGGELCLPVPPLRVRVADEQGRVTPPGVVGECQISGPGVTGQYWNNSGGAAEPLAQGGWLHTGDLAVRDRLGLVRLAGRAKDVIKCGGYSVYASEVEEALASHPAVARVAVIGLPHSDKGEVPVAVLECRAGFSPAEDELLAWCRSRLPAYKVPRRIHQVDPGSLPQGVTEKVLKRVLRERFAS